jgi:uncharacterized protein (DUF2236 family)
MSCPASDSAVGFRPGTSVGLVADVGRSRCDVVDQFDRFSGSVLVALFAAGLFDQAMLPPVSAALENTGRIRNDPIGRALRSAASEQIMFAGSDEDGRAEADRLLRLHRDVKGVGPDGIRYSALSPESWNWILISTFVMHRGAFIAVTGRHLTSAENQAIWNRFRDLTRDLHLPGRGARLVEDYDELCGYYDTMVAGKLQRTDTLDCAVRATVRPKRPDNLPAVAGPLWTATAPLTGHVLAVLGFGIMHPGVRAIVPMRWTCRHDAEFAALTVLLRLAYRVLPRRFTDTPLTRNRREYDRIMERYKGIGLTSFAPGHTDASREVHA